MPSLNQSLIGALLSATTEDAGTGLRQLLSCLAAGLFGLLLAGTAAGFGIAAIYLWLDTRLPDYQAAALLSGGLMFCGGLVMLVLTLRKPPARNKPVADRDGDTEHLIREASEMARQHPAAMGIAALAAGFAAGFLQPRK